MIQYQ